jgi:hypothetical protein
MPTLDWIGKDKVINHHKDVPYKVLERKYSFDESGMHKEDIHSNNMIIHGDNLEALKSLLPQYEGKIKCIYIDPPYNTGNEGWIYNDNVNDPKIRKWLGEVVGKEGEDLSRHDKWLCMMYPRLVLLQKLLADDGAIFISIDDNEVYNLKLICDEIFSQSNFLGDVTEKSTHNRRECPVCGHRGGSRGRFYYRITTFEGRPWDARDPHKTTFMTLKHAIRLSIWRKQKETPGVEKAPGVSSPQRKESGRSGRDDGELRFGYDPAIHARRLRVYHRPRRLRMASRISIFFAARRFEPLNSMG